MRGFIVLFDNYLYLLYFRLRHYRPRFTLKFKICAQSFRFKNKTEKRIQIVNKPTMNSRFKPITEAGNSGETKKSYCDQQFKKHLTNALIINKGEPDNIEKIRG